MFEEDLNFYNIFFTLIIILSIIFIIYYIINLVDNSIKKRNITYTPNTVKQKTSDVASEKKSNLIYPEDNSNLIDPEDDLIDPEDNSNLIDSEDDLIPPEDISNLIDPEDNSNLIDSEDDSNLIDPDDNLIDPEDNLIDPEDDLIDSKDNSSIEDSLTLPTDDLSLNIDDTLILNIPEDDSTMIEITQSPTKKPPVKPKNSKNSKNTKNSKNSKNTKKITEYFKPTPLNSTFIGLSYEKSKLLGSFFVPSNIQLITVFKLLGDSILRIGGNAVDLTNWSRNSITPTPTIENFTQSTSSVITPQIVDNLAEFIKLTEWKIIYGVNMGNNTPSNAANEAAYAASQLGDSLLAIEIGNEPDLYMQLKYNKWSYKQFCSEWKKFATAIRKAVKTSTNGKIPNVSIIGPSSAFDVDDYTVPFAKDEGKNIQILGHHYYRGNGKAPGVTITAKQTLSDDSKLETVLKKLNKASKNNKITGGYRLAECNSYYNGGAPGLSNSYPSGLWLVNFAMTNIVHGSRGINLHGGGHSTGYTPIADYHKKDNSYTIKVRPTYYGLMLVSQAIKNGITSASLLSNNVYYLTRSDGGENYVYINRDPLKNITITLNVNKPYFAILILSGNEISITLNGTSIDAVTGWNPIDLPLLEANNGILKFEVQAYTAILIKSI